LLFDVEFSPLMPCLPIFNYDLLGDVIFVFKLRATMSGRSNKVQKFVAEYDKRKLYKNIIGRSWNHM